MPILDQESSLFPDDLLDSPPAGLDSCWWVIYTKPRQEKALARDLFAQRVPYFLPLLKNTVLRRGRPQVSFLPMFRGYVFIFAAEEQRVRALKTNRICRVLEVKDQEQLLADLRRVQQTIASGLPLTVESRLANGDRVRVRYGPLAGMEGVVIVRRGKTRLLVAVHFLQQGASVEIDDFLLEPID